MSSMDEQWNRIQSSSEHLQELNVEGELCCDLTSPQSHSSEKLQQLETLRQKVPPQDKQKPYQPQEQCPHPQESYSPCPFQQKANEEIHEPICVWDDEPYNPPFDTHPNRKSRMNPYPCKGSQDDDVIVLQRKASINEQLDEEFQKMTQLVHQLELESSLNSLNLSYEVLNIVAQRPCGQEMQSSGPTHQMINVPSHEYSHHIPSQKKVVGGQLHHNLVRPCSNPQLTVLGNSTIIANDGA